MAMRLARRFLWILGSSLFAAAASLQDFSDNADLFSYVSRPDLRPPKFNISALDAAAVTPGYWFVAPYNGLHMHSQSSVYQPLQMGPHIYDSEGELVWSGAHLFPRRAVYDFRAQGGDAPELTFIIEPDMTGKELRGGAYVTLGQDYQLHNAVADRSGRRITNIHEFKRVENGSLVTSSTPRYYMSPSYGMDHVSGWLLDGGFREIDHEGNSRFEWWALDHIRPAESYSRHSLDSNTNPDKSWDFFHANSIDKTPLGDYLLSARDTSTIYLISGTDGRILWRLGGKYSNFSLERTFSNQHDGRVLSENTTTMIISLLDNAVNVKNTSRKSPTSSSALLLALDKTTWNATVLRSYARPDGRFTRVRGNFQSLPGGASLAHWSDNNYFCEYDGDGRMVLEAQLASHRFESYRTYKFNWTSLTPAEEPAIKAFAYGTVPERATTAIYVSWNGATEVATWGFYSISNESEKVIAVMPRKKFETVAMADGYFQSVKAQALDINGNELGESKVICPEVPASWSRNIERIGTGQGFLKVEQVFKGAKNDRECVSSTYLVQCGRTSYTVGAMAISTSKRAILRGSSLVTLAALIALMSRVIFTLVWRRRWWPYAVCLLHWSVSES